MKIRILMITVLLMLFSITVAQAQEKPVKEDKNAMTFTQEILCAKCGEVKGSEKCCQPEGRTVCDACGKFVESPGCCQTIKAKKAEMKDMKMKSSDCGKKTKSDCCGKPGKK